MPRVSPSVRACLLGLSLALFGGCSLWDDFGEQFPYSGPDGVEECATGVVAVGPQARLIDTTICAGAEVTYRIELAAGERLAVALDSKAKPGEVWFDLLDDRGERVALSVFDLDGGVRVEELITHTGAYDIVVGSSTDLKIGLEIVVEPPRGEVFWIAPDGDDDGDGSADAPWRNWPRATSELTPGDLLIARSGAWTELSDCSSISVTPCVAGELPDIRSTNAATGTETLPIVIAAEFERQARLFGNGANNTIDMEDQQYWVIDGLTVQSRDEVDGPGNAIRVRDSTAIVFRRILAANSNRAGNLNLMAVSGSSGVEIIESEFYDFHSVGLQMASSTGARIVRSYTNSRSTSDISRRRPDYSGSTYSNTGDIGFGLYNSSSAVLIDCFAEGSAIGFNVTARYRSEPNNSNDHRFMGTIAVVERTGYNARGACEASSCSDDEEIRRNHWEDAVAIGEDWGFRLYSNVDATLENVTAYAMDHAAISVGGGGEASSDPYWSYTITGAALGGSAPFGVGISGDTSADLDFVNAFGFRTAIDEDVGGGENVTTLDPMLGLCRAWVPTTSPLWGAGPNGGPLGAMVFQRHDENGRTNEVLWDPRDGSFPCGATVDDINTVQDSCRGAHVRLEIPDGCEFPLP